jgi:hypothetical protein
MAKMYAYVRCEPETGDPARLSAQLAGRWGQMNWNSVQRGKYFVVVLGRLEQPRQDKSLFYLYEELNESIKEGSLSCALFESPFTFSSNSQSPYSHAPSIRSHKGTYVV